MTRGRHSLVGVHRGLAHSSVSTEAWRTPRCPAGYYECAGCCDRDADCACDGACDLGADDDCALAYGAGGAKPDGWCPVGYGDCSTRRGMDAALSDCCSWGAPPPDWAWGGARTGWDADDPGGACSGNAGVEVPVPPQDFYQNLSPPADWTSRCLRAAGTASREWCGAGPRELGGWDELLPDFECSVRKVAWNMRHPKTKPTLDLWSMQTLIHTTQDQISFPYVIWKKNNKPHVLPDENISGDTPHESTSIFKKREHNKESSCKI